MNHHSTTMEKTPLLQEVGKEAKDAPLRSRPSLLARRAIVVLLSTLITAKIIFLIIFFTGRPIHLFRPRSMSAPTLDMISSRLEQLLMILGNHAKDPQKESSMCLTPACVHASSEILYNLSPDYKNIDPCTDFEELVCGGWSERHDLRPDQGDAFTGTIMFETSQMLLRHILEAPYPKDSSVSAH
jgi:endothelin-converting enzyme